MKWQPITKQELINLIEIQKEELTKGELNFYNQIKIDILTSKVERDGEIENVFVIAEFEDKIIFYEDVEEGFEITDKSIDGTIRYKYSNQYTLKHIINQLKNKH